MHNFELHFVVGFLLFSIGTAAVACDGSYDPATRIAQIPCVRVGEDRSYQVILIGNGERDFELAATLEFSIVEPPVTGLRIVGSFPVAAVISGYYPNGCWRAYERPSLAVDGNHVDFRVKARVLVGNFVCTQAIVPFVEAVPLFHSGDPRTFTYSVNGAPITPTF